MPSVPKTPPSETSLARPPARQKPARAWQRMLSGRRLDLLHPSPLDIEIEDVAHGLSRVARWNGQTTGEWPYSVAEHSLLVERIFAVMKPNARREDRLVALLHDAPEYVIGDLISPFKNVVGDGYRGLEARLFEAVLVRFGLAPEQSTTLMKQIKRADIVSAYIEAVSLAGFSEAEAKRIFGAPKDAQFRGMRIEALTPNAAKDAFLDRFHALFG